MINQSILLNDEQATLNFGKSIAKLCKKKAVIYLYGNLGSGKTTFTRGFLQALGYLGKVKSPTYTIIEQYSLNDIIIYHFDMYRIVNPKELEYIGIRDFYSNNSIVIVEWPQQGFGILPDPDIKIHINYQNQRRIVNVNAVSLSGKIMLNNLDNPEKINKKIQKLR